ncbi:L-aminopeptidase/D-esterase [Roridomyces roridus]|uniref:L-aminopeptidase/D-esterase n=1 Tax=Roridomyces roridus TaxID=1738132 RepID=A0AAD7BF61_9AGAR|nr:L-aminopeptidase/D-esterase [Roridomyces roridus]
MGGGNLPESLNAGAEPVTNRPRARDLGIIVGDLLSPGPLNSITDVPRVKVGMAEKFLGDKIVRAGVTLIGTDDIDTVPLFAGIAVMQGSGELTGSLFIAESGLLTDLVAITGTTQVGAAHMAMAYREPGALKLPIVGETFDRMTHPLASCPIGSADIAAAFADMTSGKLREGNVGGGAAMVSFGLKGGTGTASRLVPSARGNKDFVVGVLVQANHGVPYDLTISGERIGKVLADEGYTAPWFPSHDSGTKQPKDGDGSIIIVIATDAPLLPHQCSAVARRGGVGVSRGGGGTGFFSGDIFLCFSTAGATHGASNARPRPREGGRTSVNAETLDAIFRAAADATEEAILNALFAAEDMEGYTGRKWRGLPVERVREILKEAGKVPN